MSEADISSVVSAAKHMAEVLFGLQLDDSETAGVIRDVLWRDRHLWEALENGGCTKAEVISAVVQHIHSRLILPLDDRDIADWTEAMKPLEAALMDLFASFP